MGSVIALVNQKGGCGKSTTSYNLACWLQLQKQSVFFIDADAQKTSSAWVQALGIPSEVLQTPDGILERIPELEGDYDFVVVDSPGAISETIRAILMVTDLALVPTKPTEADLASTSDTIRLIRQAQRVAKKNLQAQVFLSMAKPNTNLKAEAYEFLSSRNVGLLQSVIHDRVVVPQSTGNETLWVKSKKVTPRKLKISKTDNLNDAGIAAVEFNNLFVESIKVLEKWRTP